MKIETNTLYNMGQDEAEEVCSQLSNQINENE